MQGLAPQYWYLKVHFRPQRVQPRNLLFAFKWRSLTSRWLQSIQKPGGPVLQLRLSAPGLAMASKTENQPGNAQTIAVVRERDDDLASIALTWFVQVTALAAAITFGIFSVLSWTAAENAKEQANTANLVALAALCGNVAAQVRSRKAEPRMAFTLTLPQSNAYNAEVQGFCNQLFPYAWKPLALAVAKSFPDIEHISAPQAPMASSSTISTVLPSTTTSSTPLSSATISAPSCSNPPCTGAGGASSLPGSSAAQSSVPSSSSISTTTTTSTASSATGSSSLGSPPSSSGTSAGLGTGAKICLGVGFAIGIPVVLVSSLTYLRYRKLHQRKIN